MRLASRHPFDGVPVLHLPTVFGATSGQWFLYRIPVTGERPIDITASGLPEGLSLQNGILSGTVFRGMDCKLVIGASNRLGTAKKTLTLRIAPDTVQLTPLLGFTTWNAFGNVISQEIVEQTAKLLLSTGLADYGYGYVNVDSGWQSTYGGEFNAIQPNFRFPDMKAMCDRLHGMGFRAGIYSTPTLRAWGCPPEYESIPGCTAGEPDERFPDAENGGIGKIHLEKENVRQWCAWGFDYLKYDWKPTDGFNTHLMKETLRSAERTFTYSITVHANFGEADVFRRDASSWRDNTDSAPNWENLKNRMLTVDKWRDYVCPGHFYDLDMLAVGKSHKDREGTALTDNEKVFAYTMRAFFASPIQISTPLDTVTEFDLDLFCNDEIIAINQDALSDYPARVSQDSPDHLLVYRRRLENGDEAYAVFSLSEKPAPVTVPLGRTCAIRSVWEKTDLPSADKISLLAEPHAAYVFRVSSADSR